METPQELINWMLDTKANPKLLHNLIKTTNNSNMMKTSGQKK